MLLNRTTWVVKERVALVKLTDTYDILDAQSGQPIGIAREEPPEWAKWLRLIVNKRMMPTVVNIYENDNAPSVIVIRRGVALFRPKVHVSTRERQLGYFQVKGFSIGPSFRIFDAQGTEVGGVKGDWKGWNFQLLGPSGEELGRVTRKWGGLGKELFTTADTYAIALSQSFSARPDVAALLLAAGIAIDTVFKENDE